MKENNKFAPNSALKTALAVVLIILYTTLSCNNKSDRNQKNNSESDPQLDVKDSLFANQQKLQNYALPIYVYYNGEKSLGGTCFFVKSQSDLFLVSAFHVIFQRSASSNIWSNPEPNDRVPDSFQIKFLADSTTFAFSKIDSNTTTISQNDSLMDVVVIPANFISEQVQYAIDLPGINADVQHPENSSKIFAAGYTSPDSPCEMKYGHVIFNYGTFILSNLNAEFGMSGSPCFVKQADSVKLAGMLIARIPFTNDVVLLHSSFLVNKILGR